MVISKFSLYEDYTFEETWKLIKYLQEDIQDKVDENRNLRVKIIDLECEIKQLQSQLKETLQENLTRNLPKVPEAMI